ncbi:FtsX-like permease family protein [Streptomyces sp. NPDC050504]|uniref:FtsX-like permease family protein n=1 Tax=Streptomyces sp. NPDC050504 TaxID=3365618 RepID=UPI00378B4D6F
MFTLALRSLAKRPGRALATLLSASLGAAIIMTFNSLFDTAGAPGVDDTSAETLTTTASVVGGYGTLLVFFAVASTLTVNVRQRAAEIDLLRCSGATPAQVKRMVVGEAAVIGLLGALLAAGPAMLGGAVLLDLFQDSGQVAGNVDHAFGPVALFSGVGVTLLASVGAAFLAVRRATRAAAGQGAGKPRGKGRTYAGCAALVAGAGSILTTFAVDPSQEMLMAYPAYGSILLSVGFAVLAPSALGGALARLQGPLTALTGASVYLTVRNVRRRTAELAAVLMPLIIFTGVATATLSMQAVESDAVKASGLAKSIDAKNLETLNLVVVGIVAAFCCIMLVNSLYAATSYRGREFGQQRLAGATPGQVLRTVGCESLLVIVTGVALGTVAGLAGAIPFTVVRTDHVMPGQGPGIWLGTAAVAAAAVLLTTLGTARRTLRTPAVEAVAVAA